MIDNFVFACESLVTNAAAHVTEDGVVGDNCLSGSALVSIPQKLPLDTYLKLHEVKLELGQTNTPVILNNTPVNLNSTPLSLNSLTDCVKPVIGLGTCNYRHLVTYKQLVYSVEALRIKLKQKLQCVNQAIDDKLEKKKTFIDSKLF